MRNIKELLEVMLEHQNRFISGLCNWAADLCFEDLITMEELKTLSNYIDNNRPSRFSSFDAFRHRDEDYYWMPDRIKPRLKWIRKHIKLNS